MGLKPDEYSFISKPMTYDIRRFINETRQKLGNVSSIP
jgi:hypothetical protein